MSPRLYILGLVIASTILSCSGFMLSTEYFGHNLWSFTRRDKCYSLRASKSFDISPELVKKTAALAQVQVTDEEANILICQPGDIGHLLRTVGARRQHPQHTINLYVWESQIEVMARHLLLLRVAQDWELPVRQRANTFLEIFGNCFVQDRTSHYISRLGKELVDMLFYTKSTAANAVDLSLLKCRERDQLEAVFRSWDCHVPCNMTALRDARLRNFFGTRYDHRKNLVDWDYTNRLKDVASIIHHTQYRGWRLGGIAYEFGDQNYDQPNRTMISYAEGMMVKGKHCGAKKEIRGFWLDIRVGPFITFGVDCDRPNAYAEELFAILNKGTGTEQHRHNTAEVAVYSIISYLWGMETRGYYAMTKKNDIYSGLGDDSGVSVDGQRDQTQIDLHEASHDDRGMGIEEGIREDLKGSSDLEGSVELTRENSRDAGDANPAVHASASVSDQPLETTDESKKRFHREQAFERAQCIVEAFDGVKVFMLSGDLNRHLSKPRFRQLFDRVHMSLTAVDVASSPAINRALADEALITMDTGRYMVPFNKEQQRSFVDRTCSFASEQGWKPLFDLDQTSGQSMTPPNSTALNWDRLDFSFTRKPVYA